jgi:hypothetical protein
MAGEAVLAFRDRGGTPRSGLFTIVQTEVQAGDTISNTASIAGFATRFTIPANNLFEGAVLFIWSGGIYSTPVIADRSLNLFVGSSSDAITATGIRTPSAVGVTDYFWTMEARLIITVIGAVGRMEGDATWRFYDPLSASDNVWTYASPAPATIDTTIDQEFGLGVQYSVADVNNSISMRHLVMMMGA